MGNGRHGFAPYEELRRRTDAPPGSSWGLFGADDEVGTLNFITAESVVKAAGLIERGAVFNLDYSLSAFDPYPMSRRSAPHHHIFQRDRNHRDDYLDGFFLQGSTQIDGLRHMRHPEHGFYNFAADGDIEVGTSRLGIATMAEHGIVGRGVLVDVERFLDESASHRLCPRDLDEMAEAQKVSFYEGDILLLHTGWAESYLKALSDHEPPPSTVRGLAQTSAMVEWLWDHRFAVVAADTPTVEAFPVELSTSDFVDSQPGSPNNGMLHRPLIALLGMVLGELWRLDELAAACAADARYEFFVCAKPLNLVGGVGSPANAVAVK